MAFDSPCGEMAGDPMRRFLSVRGYRYLSMNGRSVASVKYLLRHIDFEDANPARRSLLRRRWRPKCVIRRRRLWSAAGWGLIRGGLQRLRGKESDCDSRRRQHACKMKDNAYTYLLTVTWHPLTLVLLFATFESVCNAQARLSIAISSAK
ncbi:hypothetical protein KCP74_10310 [Salmonella enterica subsp. enterica]|nr:hypothetical protein KCP74_10310 [Salmonella enterica subsp. enterica]